MKKIVIAFSLFFLMSFIVEAQTDSLVINLKNGTKDIIAVSQIQKITFENINSVEEQSKYSSGLAVKGNYPNPFQEQTNFEFELSNTGNVEIFIYDNSGKEIQKLECQNCQSGKNSLQWNCLDKNNIKVPSGVYFYEVHFGNEVQAKKMLVVK